MVIQFHSNQQAQQDLLVALANNCTCTTEPDPESGQVVVTGRCPGHAALVSDQHWVDHMEFARSLRLKLLAEEFKDQGGQAVVDLPPVVTSPLHDSQH